MSEKNSSTKAAFSSRKKIIQPNDDFHSFFNAIDDFLFIVDSDGGIIKANNAVLNRLGYTDEELYGKPIAIVHPPDRHVEIGETIEAMLSGKARFCPIPLQSKNGDLIPVETHVVRGKWRGQNVLFGISKDLSELRESEEKFSKVFETSPVFIALTTLEDGIFLDVNNAFLKGLGYTKEEIISHSSEELGLFVDYRERSRIKDEVKAKGFSHGNDIRVRTKNGHFRYGSFNADIIQLQRQKCLLSVMTDITERKLMEQALLRAEAHSRSILEAMPDLLFEIDDTGIFRSYQGSKEGLFLEPELFIGKRADKVLPPDVWKLLKKAMIAARREKRIQVFEYTLQLPDSRSHDFEARLTCWEGGGYIILIRDITKRKETERNLRHLQEELEERVSSRTFELQCLSETLRSKENQQSAILSNITDIAWLKDSASCFIMVNDAFARACGFAKPEDLTGKTDFDVWPEELARLYVADDREVVGSGKQKQVVEPIADKEGRSQWIETVKTPIFNEKGEVIGTAGIARDMTERKLFEEKIKNANDMLRTLTGRLSEAEEYQLRMISRELHDQIGQNLNTISLNLALIKSFIAGSDEVTIGARIDDSLSLTKDTSVRIRNLMADIRSPVLDDYGLLAALRHYSAQCCNRTGLKIFIKGKDICPRPPAYIENVLYRVAQEALTNIAKHAGATKVKINLKQNKRAVVIMIEDNGSGYDCHGNAGGKTSGWGLVTMKERALAVGGSFRVESEIGAGTHIIVEVPL